MTKDYQSPGLVFSRRFSEKLSKASKLTSETDGMVRLVTHYDPDGMSSAAILCKVLRRLGKEFQATLTSKLDDELIESIRKDNAELYILADMGSTRIETFETFEKPVIVIDHHAPQKEGDDNVVHLNPHLFGIDGAREASGSSMCFSLAITIDETNWDLATLAIAGAVGDRQNIGGFKGYNEDLVTVAVEKELIKRERTVDLRKDSIFDSLVSCPEPFFKGLSGRKREVKRFLKNIGIEEGSLLKDLDEETSRYLKSMLGLHLLKQKATPEAVNQLVAERYWLYDRGMYADEFVALLNACARRNEYALGLSMALGAKDSYDKALKLHGKHRTWIMNKMKDMEQSTPETLKNIQYFFIDETSYTGVIAGLGTLYIFDNEKPTFGLHQGKSTLNVSARAPRSLVSKGLDLGLACKIASEKFDGAGGGHDIAAGAKVPVEKEKSFLKALDKLVGEQLAG